MTLVLPPGTLHAVLIVAYSPSIHSFIHSFISSVCNNPVPLTCTVQYLLLSPSRRCHTHSHGHQSWRTSFIPLISHLSVVALQVITIFQLASGAVDCGTIVDQAALLRQELLPAVFYCCNGTVFLYASEVYLSPSMRNLCEFATFLFRHRSSTILEPIH